MKIYSADMIFPIVAGLVVFLVLALFFYRTADMDIAGAIVAALLSSAILAALISGAIYAGTLFG